MRRLLSIVAVPTLLVSMACFPEPDQVAEPQCVHIDIGALALPELVQSGAPWSVQYTVDGDPNEFGSFSGQADYERHHVLEHTLGQVGPFEVTLPGDTVSTGGVQTHPWTVTSAELIGEEELPAGEYSLTVDVQGDGLCLDFSESMAAASSVSGTFQVFQILEPVCLCGDLAVSDLAFSTGNPLDASTISWQSVHNAAGCTSLATGPFEMRVIVTDSATGAITAQGDVQAPAHTAGQPVQHSIQFSDLEVSAPLLAGGSYQVTVELDADGAVAQCDQGDGNVEVNDTAGLAVQVPDAAACTIAGVELLDLEVQGLANQAGPGGSVSWTVNYLAQTSGGPPPPGPAVTLIERLTIINTVSGATLFSDERTGVSGELVPGGSVDHSWPNSQITLNPPPMGDEINVRLEIESVEADTECGTSAPEANNSQEINVTI